MFWTDYVQAQERLSGTFICYDKVPVLVEEVGPEAAVIQNLAKNKRARVTLDDEKWNNFRDLPKLGWFNSVAFGAVVPVHLERRAVNTRNHGLSHQNTVISSVSPDGVQPGRGQTLRDLLSNPGYLETMNGEENYPKLSEVLMGLGAGLRGAAFSSKFCATAEENGMKWLYRHNKRIGFFSGTNSLNLFPGHGYLKEELQATPSFDLSNITEF